MEIAGTVKVIVFFSFSGKPQGEYSLWFFNADNSGAFCTIYFWGSGMQNVLECL
jgi:hypothetical protein